MEKYKYLYRITISVKFRGEYYDLDYKWQYPSNFKDEEDVEEEFEQEDWDWDWFTGWPADVTDPDNIDGEDRPELRTVYAFFDGKFSDTEEPNLIY